MAPKMKCSKCGYEAEAPKHCNRPMHVEQVKGQNKLVCWMGPGCGVSDIPAHCGVPMREAAA